MASTSQRMPTGRRSPAALTPDSRGNPASSQAGRGAGARTALAWVAFTGLLLFLVVWPLIGFGGRTLTRGGLSELAHLPRLPGFGQAALNTVTLAVGSTAIAVILGMGLSWAAVRLPRRVRGPVSLIPLLPIMFPGVAYIVGWSFVFSPQQGYGNQILRLLPWWKGLDSGPFNINSYAAILILPSFLLASFVYVFVYSSMRQVAGTLEAAAVASGASPLRTFFTVTVPLVRPSMVYGTVMVFVLALGQFTAPLLLGRDAGIDVLSTEMFRVRESFPVNYDRAAALGFPLIVAGVLAVIAQRVLIKDPSRYTVHTGKAEQDAIATSRWAVVPVILYGAVTVLIPLLALLRVAASPYWSGKLTLSGMTWDQFRLLIDRPDASDALLNSVVVSVVAVLIVLPIGFFAALANLPKSTAPRFVRRLIDVVSILPIAAPAVYLGFGLVYVYGGHPFQLYATIGIIVISYVTLVIPYAARTQQAALISIGNHHVEASRVAGAGFGMTSVRVLLPLIRRGVAAGAAIMVVLLFHEFSVSVMVRSPNTQVMGSLLYEYWNQGSLPAMAVISLAMVAVTILGVALAMLFGGRNSLERQL